MSCWSGHDKNAKKSIRECLANCAGAMSWFSPAGFYAKGDITYTGELYADNANDTSVDAFSVANLRVGHNAYIDDWEIATFLGVNNLFDEAYNSNIRINAFGGRYFEPAPERNPYIGLTVRRNFRR